MPNAVVKYPVKTKVTANAVTYRGTDVVTYNADGSITLKTGGWYTATTKHRMNQYGRGVSVWQHKGEWLVKWKDYTYNYQEGMVLYLCGKVTNSHGISLLPNFV